MRWRTEGDDGQAALFDADVDRHVGRGEFRGMEFLHVRARRLVNTLPNSGRLPFRHTINAYRGCSHACTYCAEGTTPVLMADGRTTPIADLAVGDRIVGTHRVGAHRRFVVTEVLDHWSTVKPAWRVRLEDGTELVTSGDHRFLTNRGWRHVTGTGAGPDRRPHLTTTSELCGTGRFATAPADGPEYREGYLCGMVRGDGHIRLPVVGDEARARTRDYLGGRTRRGLQLLTRAEGARRPERPTLDWCKGFLAGVFDADGSFGCVVRITSGDATIVDQTVAALRRLRFRYVVEHARDRPTTSVRLLGGLGEQLRFLHTVDPAIGRKRSIEGRAVETDARLRVVSVEPLGMELPLYDVTTGTGDYLADGVVSHNCFARPTHDYLGLDIAEGFERQIVVKVNAVERLRAELDPRTWCGEPIAMGTNTDPYQRCEGKYHLTRGLIEVLAAARNPFSLLTKSTLVLRDADVLAEAAARTDVTVNLSIGTLDPDVWRATEPGTPPPEKRVEAIARLRDAGVPCGVLVAPVLPGLSDGADQIDAVVAACAEAGASTISGGMVVYLKPGVREVFFDHLAATHPDLVERYDAMFAGVRAPRAVQDRVSRLLREAVARHRGTHVAVTRNRAAPARQPVPSPPPERRPQPQQLGLAL